MYLRQLVLSVLVWIGTAFALSAQDDFSISYTNPDSLEVCGSDTLFLSITNIASTTLTGINVQVNLATGIYYSDNSVQPLLTNTSTNFNQPHFNLPDIASGESYDFYLLLEAPCEAYDEINTGVIFTNSFTADHSGSNATTINTNPYPVLTPLLVITDISPQNQIVSMGDTITRTITIQNTRLGTLENFEFTNESNGSIIINGVQIGTITNQNDTIYTIQLGATDFQLFGDGDSLFESNESIIITEEIVVTSCENGFSEFSTSWGCNGEICQTDEAFGNLIVDPNLAAPDLLFMSGPQHDDCYCGDTPTKQRMTIQNLGDADAIDLTFHISSVDSISGIDPSSFTAMIDSVATPISIVASNPVTPPDLVACLAPIASEEGVSLLFPLIPPGATVIIEWDMYFCVPYCNDLVSGWYYNYSYFEGCPEDQEIEGVLSLSDNIESFSHNLYTGASSINEGDTLDFYYEVHSGLLTQPEGFLQIIFDMTDRITWDGDVSSLNLLGGEAPTSYTYDPDTDSLVLFYDLPLTNVDEFLILNGLVSCSDDNIAVEIHSIEVDTRLYLSDDCPTDGSCGINPCALSELFTVVCDVVPDSIGNICIYDYTFERSNFGQADNDNDRVPDAVDSINLDLVRKDRAITGDTIYERIPAIVGTLGHSNMTEGFVQTTIHNGTNMNNNTYLVSPIGITSHSAVLTYVDISTGAKYIVENIPYTTQHLENGNQDTLIYTYDINVSTLNSLGANLPNGFSFEGGDSLLLENQYVVRQGRFHPVQRLDEITATPHAGINNTSGGVAENVCSAFFREMEITGFLISIDLPGDFAVCAYDDRLMTMSQHIGGEHNFFPWEYRNFGLFSAGTFYFDTDIESTWNPRELQFADINFNPTYSSQIVPSSISNGEVMYDILTHYQNNMDGGHIPDEEYVILLNHEAQAVCNAAGEFQYETEVTYDATYIFNEPKLDQYLRRNGALTQSVGDTLYTIERSATKTVFKPQIEFAANAQTITSFNEDVSWLFDLTNLSSQTDMYNVWVEVIPGSSSLSDFEIIYLVNDDTLQATNGIFQLDSIAAGNTIYLQLDGKYNSCELETLALRYGWGCETFTGNGEEVCEDDMAFLSVVPEFPELELDIESPVGGTDLCDTIDYHTIRVYNADKATAYDVFFQTYIPPGLAIASGTVQLSYRNNTSFVNIPDPTYNAVTGFWQWNISAIEATIGANGLAGILDFPDNTFYIRFKLVSNCDIVVNSYLVFNTTHENRCAEAENSVARAGDPININGASTPYTTTVDLTLGSISNCADEIPVLVNISKGSFVPVLEGDSLFVTLPSGVSYIPNSFTGIQNASLGEPTIQLINSHYHLSWQLPIGFTFGNIVLTFDTQLENSYTCVTDIFLAQTVRPADLICVTTNQPCTVDIETGSDFESFLLDNPAFTILDFDGTLDLGNSTVDYSIEVENTGNIATAGNPVIIDYYFDVDYSGDLSEGDVFVDSILYMDNLLPDSTFLINGSLNLSTPYPSCNLMAVIDPNKHCDCGTDAAIIELPITTTIVTDTLFCGTNTIDLGVVAQDAYTYNWQDDAGIDCDNCATTTITLPNGSNPITATYTLEESRLSGCMQVYDFNVTAYLIDDLVATIDTTLCDGETWTINVTTPLDSIWWTHTDTLLAEDITSLTIDNSIDTLVIHGLVPAGCITTDTVFISATSVADFYLQDTSVCAGTVLTLNAFDSATDSIITTSNVGYEWTPSTNLSCDDCPNPSLTATTSMSYSLTISDGSCSQTESLDITILPTYSTTENITICAGESYSFAGVDYTTTGTWCEDFTAINGCDSTACLNLTVLDTFYTTEVINICQGESVSIFGNTETESGIYSMTFTAANTCDSTHQIELIVSDTILTTEEIMICAGESTTVFGNTETESGFFSQTFSTVNGCDSTHQISLSVLSTLATEEFINICDGETVDIFGTPTTDAGDYSQTFTSTSGCDSTHTIYLSVLPNSSSFDTIEICQGTSVSIFGNEETTSGTYSQTYTSANGCDSVATIELILLDTFFTTEVINICQGESASIFGNTETESGIYSMTFTAANTCDSTHQIELIVSDTILTTEEIMICEGESASIFGNTETESGFFSQTFSTVNGCDSTHQISLSVLSTLSTEEFINICDGETIDIFGTATTDAGNYSQTFTSTSGCDSTHTIHLSVLPNSSSFNTIEICTGASATIFGNEETTSGTYSESYTSANGCDSVATIELIVLDAFFEYEERSICEGESSLIFGNTETQEGLYIQELQTADGCDSITHIQLYVFEPANTNETIQTCEGESLIIFGQTITESGEYCEVFTTVNGCDSTHCVSAIFTPEIEEESFIEICTGGLANVFGTLISEAGDYTQTYVAVSGCDSTHTIHLSVLSNSTSFDIVEICEGESSLIFGNEESTAGIYTETSPSSNGCDSTATIELILLEPYFHYEEQSICQGETTTIFGNEESLEGLYVQNLTDQNGCDSVNQIQLYVLSPYLIRDTLNACERQSLTLFGETITQTGEYCELFSDVNGCDSTHCTYVFFSSTINTEESFTICEGEAISVFEDFVSEAGTYTNVFTNQWGCDSTHTVHLFVNEPTYSEEAINICEEDSLILNEVYYPIIAEEMQIEQIFIGENGCDSTHTWFVSILEGPEVYILNDSISTAVPGDEFIQLETEATPMVEYAWTPADGLSCADCPDPTANVQYSNVYQVQVTDNNGCTAEDQILIEYINQCVPDRVKIPNAITPNGDGVNDGFWIYEHEGLDRLEYLRVWNRWGELVYETDNFNDRWYGRYKGEKLNPGVYAYMIKAYCYGNEPYVVKGNVTILK